MLQPLIALALQDADASSMRSIDTAFEAAGLLMAYHIREALFASLLPLILLAGIAFVVHQALVKQDFKQVLFYTFYVLIMFFLMSPIEHHIAPPGVQPDRATTAYTAPRFLVWMNSVCDFIVGRAAGGFDQTTWNRAFRVQRLTHMVAEARIKKQPNLRISLRWFLDNCYVPAMAQIPRESLSPSDVVDPIGAGGSVSPALRASYNRTNVDLDESQTINCGELADALAENIVSHVEEEHSDTVDEIVAQFNSDPTTIRRRYTQRLVYNEAFGETPKADLARGRFVPGGDKLIDNISQRTLAYMDNLEHAAPPEFNHEGRGSVWDAVGDTIIDVFTAPVAVVEYGWNLAKEGGTYATSWLTKETTPLYARYLVTMMGPAVYGIVIMILMAFSPIVALFAFWPGKSWQDAIKPLVNFGKIFLSVKLWVLFWTMLGQIEATATMADAEALFETNEVSGSSVALAAGAMYLIVPVLSYMLVSMMATAVAVPLVGARDSGMTEGYGAVKTVGGDAARIGARTGREIMAGPAQTRIGGGAPGGAPGSSPAARS